MLPQGHIFMGLQRRFKEFRRTPRHMTNIKKEMKNTKQSQELEETDIEDEEGYKRHVSALKAEYRRGNKANKVSLSQLMALTYKRRRADIVANPKNVVLILKEFPVFDQYEQVR